MKSIKIYDVVDNTALPAMVVDNDLKEGDPIEINGEMYYVCDKNYNQKKDNHAIGVIPLVVKNPANVKNIKNYLNCLSIAHRRVQFKKGEVNCDLNNCDEMIIS